MALQSSRVEPPYPIPSEIREMLHKFLDAALDRAQWDPQFREISSAGWYHHKIPSGDLRLALTRGDAL
jgi:hypothetical protein